MSSAEIKVLMNALADQPPNILFKISFDLDGHLQNDDYQLLTGLSLEQFNNLLSYVSAHLRSSKNRSVRTALGIFLMKMRLGISQTLIAFLCGLPSQSNVSEVITAVMEALLKEFVPKFLGFNHLPRLELKTPIPQHVRTILELPTEPMITVVDGTYIFIEKPSDMELQRKTFSLQKNRNLVKPMMIVAPNGYIVAAEGPYYSDYSNNDAAILNSLLKSSTFFVKDDHLILDRSLRYSLKLLTDMGLTSSMPKLLPKDRDQFTAIEGRWTVESCNGRIKNVFAFFDHTVPMAYLPKVDPLFQIVCAILNAYFKPLVTESDDHEKIAAEILRKVGEENMLKPKVEDVIRKKSLWTKRSAETIMFPKLSLDDMKIITLGIYQTNLAPLYTTLHLKNSEYSIFTLGETNILRVNMESRYRRQQSHKVFVEFKSGDDGPEAILGWYCTCKVGSRVVGCCGHSASVLWYLGHALYEGISTERRSLAANILDAGEQAIESDEEDQ